MQISGRKYSEKGSVDATIKLNRIESDIGIVLKAKSHKRRDAKNHDDDHVLIQREQNSLSYSNINSQTNIVFEEVSAC